MQSLDTHSIVWNIDEKRRRLRRLLDFIKGYQDEYYEGCPRLFLYSFAKHERVTSSWLHGTLVALELSNVLRAPSRDHYQVIAYDHVNIDKALYL